MVFPNNKEFRPVVAYKVTDVNAYWMVVEDLEVDDCKWASGHKATSSEVAFGLGSSFDCIVVDEDNTITKTYSDTFSNNYPEVEVIEVYSK